MSKLLLFVFLVFGSVLVQAKYNYDSSFGEEEDNSIEEQQMIRNKRGGYIQQKKIGASHYGSGISSGGHRMKSPAAIGSGAYGASKNGYSSKPSYDANYGTGYSAGGSLPGPSSLYSYAPRRANAAVYGGIYGPQTNEEALKFDTHMTRSMIADALASRGHRLYSGHSGIISAAIQSRRNVQYYDVPSTREAAEPITIEVGASPTSQLNIKFKSASSPLVVDQDHESSPGSVRETSSEDEPHRLIHTVTRPIYQEVHEVIKPFRKITQEIQPVQEDIQTIVAKGDEMHGVGISDTVQLDADDAGAAAPIIPSPVRSSESYTTDDQGPTGLPVKPNYGAGPYSSMKGNYGGGYSLGKVKPMNYGSGASLGNSRVTYNGNAKPWGPTSGYGKAIHKEIAHGEISVPFSQVQIPVSRRAARGARA